MSETKRYRVIGIDISHNGRTFHEGDPIDLPDVDAADLRQFLVLVEVEVTDPSTPNPSESPSTPNEADVPDAAPADAPEGNKKGKSK